MLRGIAAMLISTFVLSRLLMYAARPLDGQAKVVFANLVSLLVIGGLYLWISLDDAEGPIQFVMGLGFAAICQGLWYWLDNVKLRLPPERKSG